MSKRARPTVPLVCAALAAALTLTACGGGEKKKEDAAPAGPPTTMAPMPKVQPAQVKALVGRWVGVNKDYFEFQRDGAGVWMKDKQQLWKGQAIPDGTDKYRFSWEGGDPQAASYWGVKVTDNGAKLVFAGTNQSYTKSKAK
ncbi:hypothetical protein [Actinomadura macrotermitis]|uniref:Lipoprotein n=1 Tax=Actinomadura macrotermitis TaxID=2585200 RepID=A0A7K0C534_9ACTN|nr:hypothetical protein [Actinomadura macrotermitis]MQY08466.1 hypothetical protein [Actinomadura macrotermitis]